MSEDDNTSHLEEERIDRQIAAMQKQLAALQARGIFVSEPKDEPKNAREKRIVDGVLLAAIAALGWALWNLNATVATLQTANLYQDAAIAANSQAATSLSQEMRELQGRQFRGVDGYDTKEPQRAAPRR